MNTLQDGAQIGSRPIYGKNAHLSLMRRAPKCPLHRLGNAQRMKPKQRYPSLIKAASCQMKLGQNYQHPPRREAKGHLIRLRSGQN